jgi:hypothetical protein
MLRQSTVLATTVILTAGLTTGAAGVTDLRRWIRLIENTVSDNGSSQMTCALKDAPRVAPKAVWLKGWGENKGVPEALYKAGLLKPTAQEWQTGFCRAQEAEILPPLAASIEAAFSESV